MLRTNLFSFEKISNNMYEFIERWRLFKVKGEKYDGKSQNKDVPRRYIARHLH